MPNDYGMERDAGKKPTFVPESGEYADAFEAMSGIKRLMSFPGRSREDAISVIVAITESRLASRSPEVSKEAYQLITAMGSPQDAIELNLFAKAISTLPAPGDKPATLMGAGDRTGTMAALLLMSAKTGKNAVDAILKLWGVVPSPQGDTLRNRTTIINRIVELARNGVAVMENENIGYPFAAIIQSEGWNSPFANSLLKEMPSLPYPLSEIVMDNAPAPVKARVIMNELEFTKKAATLTAALTRWGNAPDSNIAITRFLLNEEIGDGEKVKLYEFLLDNPDKLKEMLWVREAGIKLFASIPSQATFDVALDKFLDGSDTISVRELTGNIELAILDYAPIFNKLNHDGMLDKADQRFVSFAKAILSNHDQPDLDDHLDSLLDGEDKIATNNDIVRMGGMTRNINMAILAAAILISLSLPVSMVMSRLKVSGDDLSSRPDLVSKGKQIASMSKTSKEYAVVVERAKKLANLPLSNWSGVSNALALDPQAGPGVVHPKATTEQRAQAHEINRRLIDTVVMLEHVSGKDFSSVGAGGQMQLMPDTWNEINKKQFGGKYPFEQYAKNDWVNRKFGMIYLGQIKDWLDDHKNQWKTDQLPLIFACYFGGIGNIQRANFDPVKLKKHYPKTYDYMVRGSSLMGYDTAKL